MTASANNHPPLAGAWGDRGVPLVVLDLASVETYLLVQPLACLAFEQEGAVWCPLSSAPAPLDRDRQAAQARADRLGLELAWPQRHPHAVLRAMRVAALACARGRGADFMLGMSRLLWGSGRSLEDPGGYELVAGELGIEPREASAAAQEGSAFDLELQAIAGNLGRLGITTAPALRWQGEVYMGSQAVAPVLSQSQSSQPRWE
jgi:2-hydroxychromene-2-carboxylate isomerase